MDYTYNVYTRKMTYKRTYDRWGLKDGVGKLRIETSGGE
jgi:hypothetical protein